MFIVLLIIMPGSFQTIFAQESVQPGAEELAKKLSNPIASLIRVPFQKNTDVRIGTINMVFSGISVSKITLSKLKNIEYQYHTYIQ